MPLKGYLSYYNDFHEMLRQIKCPDSVFKHGLRNAQWMACVDCFLTKYVDLWWCSFYKDTHCVLLEVMRGTCTRYNWKRKKSYEEYIVCVMSATLWMF